MSRLFVLQAESIRVRFQPEAEKKKKRPPLEAFNNCKPRFHNKKAQAVETIPKYKRPPRILGSSSCGVKIVLGFTKGVSATMATKVEYVVTSIGE